MNILNVLDISDIRSTFTVFFWIRLQWNDPSKDFFFLRNEYTDNSLDQGSDDHREKEVAYTLKFLHLYDTPTSVFENDLFIKRSSGPEMDAEMEALMPREKYLGSKNCFYQGQ